MRVTLRVGSGAGGTEWHNVAQRGIVWRRGTRATPRSGTSSPLRRRRRLLQHGMFLDVSLKQG